MTRDEAKKAAEVMLAYADGKEIEYNNGYNEWESLDKPRFNWEGWSSRYRISPESEERHKEIKAIDWEQRRYDIVKDLVVQFCHNDMNFVSEPFCSEDLARIDMAVHYADAIIEELKKTSK